MLNGNFNKKILSSLIILNLVFPASFAANLEIDSRVNFRIASFDSSRKPILKSLAVLPKGTVVEIPDEFIIKTNDKINVNASLNNWLQKDSSIKQNRFDKRGRPAYDNFFKVKIVSIPGDKTMNGQYGFIALKSIAERGGIKLETIEKTDLIDSSEFAQAKPTHLAPSVFANASSKTDTEAKTCLGDCQSQNNFTQKIRQTLGSQLLKLKNTSNTLQRSKHSGDGFDAIAKNFERTCFGLKFDDFVNYIQKSTPEKNIPSEVMLGIMTQESAGICHALGDKRASSKSVGLFQLNTGTVTHIDPCTRSQLQALNGKSIEQMASERSLRCLQNPAVNLQAGMDVFLNKYREVNKTLPASSTWETMSLTEKDNFRKALSAYNGGALWVNIAQSDIRYAKDKFDIDLKNDWETMRLFMFRHRLRENGYVGKNKTRATKWELSNVAYVDAILGRGTGKESQKGFTDQWQIALNRNSSISVASR
jgi:hypothetical protein